MNDRMGWIIAVFVFFVFGLLLGYDFGQFEPYGGHRYTLQTSGKMTAYRIDRKTGETWFLVRSKAYPVKR